MLKQAFANNITIATLTLGLSSAVFAADAQLTLHPYQADEKGFNVSSVLITGKKEAVLIDAQYTQADAHRLVAEVLASGKKLKLVYVSQGDPDYYFGLEVIKQAFPDVKIIATQATVDHIKATLPEKLKVWGPMLGANGPKQPIVPDVLVGDSFELEGQKLQVIGQQGATPLYTFVWIPSVRAVVGGVRVFGNMHLWTTDVQTPQERQHWVNDLKRIETLKPLSVVPGHAKAGSAMDLTPVHYSEAYLAAYEVELEKAKDSAALIKAMKQRYPDSIGDAVLELGAKVNKGEMPWVAN